MGILDSILSDDLVTLTDPDFFGETVVYTAFAAGEGPRPVQASVLRQPLLANGDRAATKHLEVLVSANPIVGIPTKPVCNKDTITVAWSIGGTVAAFVIAEVMTQDAGGWLLKLKGA